MAGELAKSRPATEDDGNDILIPIVSGMQELIFGSPGLFVDRPGFIAGPPPQSGLAGAVQDLTRFNCRQWANSPKTDYSPGVNAGNADLCGPYLDSLGENPDAGDLGPSFEGGQCPVFYNINGNVVTFANDCTEVNNPLGLIGVIGPISNLKYDNSGSVGNAPPTCQGAKGTLAFVTDGNGNKVALAGSGGGVKSATITVSRLDGQPDNCGDPPPELTPPTTVNPGIPLPPNITINVPGIGPIDVTLTLNPQGEPVVCIPELDVCVTVEPPPGGGGGGGGGPTGPPPGDVGEPGLPEGTGSGGSADGEAPPGTVLVGLKLDLVSAPVGAREFAPGVYRGGAYIYMGTPTGLDQDYAGSMLKDGQFVFAERDNLTKWRVDANVGFTWNVTPYYRSVEA